MKKVVKTFRRDESGAVTVDWVVLTALGIALCVATFNAMSDGATGLGGNTESFMGSQR